MAQCQKLQRQQARAHKVKGRNFCPRRYCVDSAVCIVRLAPGTSSTHDLLPRNACLSAGRCAPQHRCRTLRHKQQDFPVGAHRYSSEGSFTDHRSCSSCVTSTCVSLVFRGFLALGSGDSWSWAPSSPGLSCSSSCSLFFALRCHPYQTEQYHQAPRRFALNTLYLGGMSVVAHQPRLYAELVNRRFLCTGKC